MIYLATLSAIFYAAAMFFFLQHLTIIKFKLFENKLGGSKDAAMLFLTAGSVVLTLYAIYITRQ